MSICKFSNYISFIITKKVQKVTTIFFYFNFFHVNFFFSKNKKHTILPRVVQESESVFSHSPHVIKFVVGQVASINIESKIFTIKVWKKEGITKGDSKSIFNDIGLVKFSIDIKGAKYTSEEFDCSAAARKLNRVMEGIPKITNRTTSKYFRIVDVNATAIY